MLNPLYTRIALLTVAFGLFFGCTQEPAIQEAKLNLNRENYQEAVRSANRAIKEKPESPEAYYYHGVIHYRIAQQKVNPSKRKRNYRFMRGSLSQAKQLYEKQELPAKEQRDINPLLQEAWSDEHNSGVRILKNDTSMTDDLLTNAIAHLENATTIIPDSTISLEALANAYYKADQYQRAITTFEKLVQKDTLEKDGIWEKLAYLHLEQGNAEEATRYYSKAEAAFTENVNVIHGLANAYISQSNHNKSVPLLRDLVQRAPNNLEYRMTLGTELYYFARQKLDSVIAHKSTASYTDSTFEAMMQQKRQDADQLLMEAEQHFLKAVSLDRKNPEVLQTTATFHQNTAALYKQLREALPEEERQSTNQLIDTHLEAAIPYYQNLVDSQQETKPYWDNLFQIYSYLGQTEKAEEALQKANPDR